MKKTEKGRQEEKRQVVGKYREEKRGEKAVGKWEKKRVKREEGRGGELDRD